MKIERVVCANETHEIVLVSGDENEHYSANSAPSYWCFPNRQAGSALIEDAEYMLNPDAGWTNSGAFFENDKVLIRRPKGALPRPESEAPAVDPRDARIAELEAALVEANARTDAAQAAQFQEIMASAATRAALEEGVEIVACERRRVAELVAWKTSAQRIANCAVSVVEYLQSLEPGRVDDDYAHDAAMVGVDLVLKALKEMQS